MDKKKTTQPNFFVHCSSFTKKLLKGLFDHFFKFLKIILHQQSSGVGGVCVAQCSSSVAAMGETNNFSVDNSNGTNIPYMMKQKKNRVFSPKKLSSKI